MTDIDIDESMPALGSMNVLKFLWRAVKDKNDARAVVALIAVGVAVVPPIIGFGVPLAIGAVTLREHPMIFKYLSDLPLRAYLLVGIGIGSFLTSLWTLADRRMMKSRLLKNDIQADFKIIQCVSLCLVHSKDRVTYRHRYLVKACRSGVKHFAMGYTWSGEGKFEVVLRNPSFDFSVRPIAPGTRRLLDIDLRKTMNKGDIENIEFDFVTDTSGGRGAIPYYGLTIPSAKFPSLNTHLIVSFAKGCKMGSFHKETYFAAMADRSLRSVAIEPVGNRVKWVLPTKVGWRYSITWEFEN